MAAVTTTAMDTVANQKDLRMIPCLFLLDADSAAEFMAEM